MTYQTTEPLRDWRLSGSGDREAVGIINTMLDQIELNPPYQRGSVWTYEQRIALIKSWLMGVPIPGIIVNDRFTPEWNEANGRRAYDSANATWAVVDGKQRIETAIEWFAGRLPVPASWFAAGTIKRTVNTADGEYVTCDGLTVIERRHIGHQFRFPWIEAKLPTLTAEAELYLLVNGGGTAHTEDDLERAASVAGGAGERDA